MAITLVVTPSGANSNSYLTVSGATTLANLHMNGAAFMAIADDDAKARILATGSRWIDIWRNWAKRLVKTQAMAFPRVTDKPDVIPTGVINALIEIAVFMADDQLVSLKQMQAEGLTGASILGQSLTWAAQKDGAARSSDLPLPAAARRFLELLWEQEGTDIVRSRKYDGSSDPDSIFG